MASLKDIMDLEDEILELGERKDAAGRLKEEIDKMLEGFKEFTPEEKLIMVNIQETLREHDLKFSYDPDDPRHIDLGFGIENKPFRMNIIYQNGKVIYRICFPFRVQSNAIPLVTMYMAEFNSDKAFSHMRLDMDDGELTMGYSYILEDSACFDKKVFWIYMMSLIRPSLEIYTKMAHLSVGMVSSKQRRLYELLLEKALETLKGEYEEDDVSYGIENLPPETDERESIIAKLMENEDDSDDHGDDFFAEMLSGTQSHGRIALPSFEEFMRMKEQHEGKDKDEKPEENPEDILSMFAKDGSENPESGKAVAGGNNNG